MIWQYTLRLRSPLSLSERKPDGTFLRSHDYIPGAIVRGALAGSLLEGMSKDTPLFRRLFLDGETARISNALPTESTDTELRVVPQTAWTCKTHKGFRGEIEPSQRGHGVFDVLIDQGCEEWLRPALWLAQIKCRKEGCQSPVERFDKLFYADVAGQYRQRTAQHRLLTRVALNRERGVAEDELLYSPHVIAEGSLGKDGSYTPMLFRGWVRADDVSTAEAQTLEAALKRITQLGGGGSRGLGRAEIIEVKKFDALSTEQQVQQRVLAFNDAVLERLAQWQALRPQREPPVRLTRGQFFTLTLESDAILRDAASASTFCLAPALFPFSVGQGVQLLQSFAAYDYRGGWNALWALPKQTELVARMGSAYLYWAEQLDYAALARLEREGVGEYRAVGYGQVRVCHEFHRVFREEAK